MPSFPLQEERRLGKAVACQRLKVHRITKLEGVRDHPVQYTVDGETGGGGKKEGKEKEREESEKFSIFCVISALEMTLS